MIDTSFPYIDDSYHFIVTIPDHLQACLNKRTYYLTYIDASQQQRIATCKATHGAQALDRTFYFLTRDRTWSTASIIKTLRLITKEEIQYKFDLINLIVRLFTASSLLTKVRLK